MKRYNGNDNKIQLKNFRSHFEVLNNLLEALIKDIDLKEEDKKYLQKLLNESKIRESEVNKNKM